MPSEPEKRMEPLLKAYAEKRRQAAAGQPELHPATRRLLQSEVRQRWPARQGESRRWYHQLLSLWPRLLTAGAIAVVLGLGLWYWGPARQQSTYLAKEDSPPRLPERPTDEMLPASTRARNEPALDSQTDKLRLAEKPAGEKKLAEAKVESKLELESIGQRRVADQPVPAVPAPPTQTKAKEVMPPGAGTTPQGPALASAPIPTEPPAQRLSEPLARGTRSLSDQQQPDSRGFGASAPAPTTAPMPVSTLSIPAAQPAAAIAFTESETAAARQYYFRNLSATPQRPAMAGAAPEPQRQRLDRSGDRYATRGGSVVLASFAIEQRGPVLRIIDGDGSVYEGRVVTNAAPALEFDLGKQVALKRDAPAPANSVSEALAVETSTNKDATRPQVAFEVYGTNKTLRQSLSLAGTLYYSSTNALTATNITRIQQGLGTVRLNDQEAADGKVQAAPAIPQVLRVRGLGRVNGSNEVPVDAIPAPR